MPKLSDVLRHLTLPVIGAPLFIISNPKLVIAQCKAGVIGAMPALNARPESQLDEWLAEITETLAAHDKAHPDHPAAPYAVNQIVHKSNDHLDHDMAMVLKYKVPIIISSLGARTDVNAAIHGYGGVVLHDIATHEARASDAYKQTTPPTTAPPTVPTALPTKALLRWIAPRRARPSDACDQTDD